MPPNRPTIFLQRACYNHRYIRSRDQSTIVERPERLQSVTLGLSAALARLESLSPSSCTADNDNDNDTLEAALDRLAIAPQPQPQQQQQVLVVHSTRSVDILTDPAVNLIHGDTYPAHLRKWALDSRAAIDSGASEIPMDLPQGDLYLCPESIEAVQGALGAVCEAVDSVIASQHDRRAFVVVRPPGHHCADDSPAGFCFVNNVAVGAAHAHLKHGVNRVIVLDIDLHHGNGTQAIVWRINEETHRLNLEDSARARACQFTPAPELPRRLQMYYGSTHDILSYPCEDGSQTHITAASMCIHGAHGQYIENVHLQPCPPRSRSRSQGLSPSQSQSPSLSHPQFQSQSQSHPKENAKEEENTHPKEENEDPEDPEDPFWHLYEKEYARILRRAEEFVERTGGPGDDVLVFVSCGFDASEHEHASMSRHGHTVPTTFFAQFARDARGLAERCARGRLVGVLEGGYGERALVGGAMAFLCGLSEAWKGRRQGREGGEGEGEGWWDVRNLGLLEKAMRRRQRRLRRQKGGEDDEAWVTRTFEIFDSLEEGSRRKKLPRVVLRLGPDPGV